VVVITLGQPGARSVVTAPRKFERLVSSNLLDAEVRAALARERVAALPDTFAGVDWILPDRSLTRRSAACSRPGRCVVPTCGISHARCIWIRPQARCRS
jgi:hypothetical protein